MSATYTFLESPFGEVLVAWSARGLERVGIGPHPEREADSGWRLDRNLDCEATRQLRAYFEGRLRRFDLPLVMDGTPFQRAVWQALTAVPFATTVSYGEVGARIGRPAASRAVGMACGRNPLPIVVPCHRVVGKDGSLVGFGGGLPMKQALLWFERSSK